MKTYSKLAVAMMVGCCLLQGGQALAGTITNYYQDTAINFSSYSNPAYNATDSVGGMPDITGVYVTLDDVTGQLLQIKLVSDTAIDGFYSLFLNTDSNTENWNYFAITGTGTANDAFVAAGGMLPGDGLYAVASGFSYTTVKYGTVTIDGTDYTGREGHPNAIDANSLGDSIANFLTPTLSADGLTLTYDFSNLDITLATSYQIGWTPYCANDVIDITGKYTQQPPANVPEPVTMVLFGAGIATLAGWHRRKGNTLK